VTRRIHVGYEFRNPLLIPVLESLPAEDVVDIGPMYVADSAFTHEISRPMSGAWKRFPQR
jgi:hypothetical protein